MVACVHDESTGDLFGFTEEELCLVEERKAGLPPSIRNLIVILGSDKAYGFLKKYGGINIRIPCRLESKSKLTKEMDSDQFKAFVMAFNPNLEPHKLVSMPKGDKIMQLVRNQAVCDEKASGASLSELALKYELSIRQIQKVIKGD